MQGSQSTSDRSHTSQVLRRSAERLQTIFVLSLALVLRLLVVWTVLMHYPRGWFYTRGVEMGLLANSIVAGHGLSSPFGGFTGPTAFIAPAYPLLTAGVFRLFGCQTAYAAVFLMALQVAANLLTVWLILTIARRLSGQGAAWIAGLFWACSLPLIWMPTIFWDTSFSACIITGAIAIGLRCRGRFNPKLAAGGGAYCGLAALMNPALLPLLASVVVWLAWQSQLAPKRKGARLLLAACVFTIVFSPWPIRNARVFHAFIPLRTTVGFELWMGNRDGATGFLDESVFPMYNRHELDQYKAQGEVAYTNGKSRLAKSYIISHPGTFLRMTGRRFIRFWSGTGSQGGSALFALHACLTSLLGLAGLWLLYRRHGLASALLFALPLVLFPLPYYITHAEFRYRLVIDPLMTILSGCAVMMLAARGRAAADSPALAPESKRATLA